MPNGGSHVTLPPDRRSQALRARDRRQALKQARRVAEGWRDTGRWDEITDLVVERRHRRAGEGYEEAEKRRRGNDSVLLVAHERLVRTDGLADEARRELVRRGATEVPNLRGRVLRVVTGRRGPSGPARDDAIDESDPLLRTSKDHYFAPMGPVMKLQCSPEPAIGLGRCDPVDPGGVRVAIIDTGIAAATRTDGWLVGIDETPANRDPLDVFAPEGLDYGAGHGTFGAGIVRQLARDADVRIYRALDSDGLGSEAAVASAMVQAAMDGAQIINLSLGMETLDGQPPVALDVAVDIIRTDWPDVLIVAAAGNYGHDVPCWPAAFDGVTAVAALDRDLQPIEWSSRGDWVQCSTIGEAVLSTFVPGEEEEPDEGDTVPDKYEFPSPWAVWSGTSFAAPQIVGAVAQLMSKDGLDAQAALAAVLEDGTDMTQLGFGRAVKLLEAT